MMKIESLHIYPVKSMRGMTVPRTILTPSGLLGDRRFMVVDPAGHFITQRECAALAKITALPEGTHLKLEKDGEQLLVVPQSSPRMNVEVWRSVVNAGVAADSVNARLSEWLGREVRLVFADSAAQRFASPDWAGEGVPMGFADGYPILITTTGSLQALNRYLEENGQKTVSMDRFRPNVVIDDDGAFSEDRWESIEIGGVALDLVKPCERCIITKQDQLSGEQGHGDPLPAIRHLHFSMDKRVPGPIFGWNVVPRGQTELKVGDRVRILSERREAWPFKVR